MKTGKVYITGVGPGDYGLITVKAKKYIEKAEVIVYDRLVDSRILKFARKDAELIYVGKMPDCHIVPQDNINEILVQKALEGKMVVRVKGGDPFVFGRGGEEAERLYKAGIPFEVIPGITSAIAVPAYAGIPVTHRDYCSSFHIITGHENPDKEESSINYKELAKVEGTLVFLMGVKGLQSICENLINHGKPANTPAAIIERGTTSEQRVVRGTLKDIWSKAASESIKSPAVTVIGHVAELRDKLAWFEKAPLSGKRVVVTRTREQAGRLVELIEDNGGEAIEIPTIKIMPPDSFEEFDSVLSKINTFNYIVFTSANGVEAFLGRMKHNRMDIRSLYGIKLCAIGSATEACLNEAGLNAYFVPVEYTTEKLLEGLLKFIVPGDNVLLARADIASPGLAEGLKASGVEIYELTAYRTMMDDSCRERLIELLEEERIDALTFASSSTVTNFVSLIGKENICRLSGIKTVCIGPVTEKTARDAGINVTATADECTIEGVVQKLIQVVR